MDCTYCHGSGTAPLDGYPVRCLHCHGDGTVQEVQAPTEPWEAELHPTAPIERGPFPALPWP